MGILGLSKLVADVAASAIKVNEIKNYFGRKVAIDASMSLYQFLIAVRGVCWNFFDLINYKSFNPNLIVGKKLLQGYPHEGCDLKDDCSELIFSIIWTKYVFATVYLLEIVGFGRRWSRILCG